MEISMRTSLAPRQALFERPCARIATPRLARLLRLRAAAAGSDNNAATLDQCSRRQNLGSVALAAAALASAALAPQPAAALGVSDLGFKKDLTNKRRQKIPESAYSEGPQGLKYYDVMLGTGAEAALGERVVVHYECKYKGVTFVTSRQGIGVTGGNPLGFDVGAKPGAGGTLAGLDLGVRGMKVGGRRKLLVPPELAYGSRGFGEIPGGATVEFDVELLSVKQDAVGFRTKLIEG